MMSSKLSKYIFGAVVLVAIVVAGVWISSARKEREQIATFAALRSMPVDAYADIQERLQRIEAEDNLTSSDREAISRYATDESEQVRRYSITMMNLGLRDSSPEEVIAFTEGFLDDESPFVRKIAYMTLFKRDPDGWEKYRGRIESDPDPGVQHLIDLFEGESEKSDETEQS